ncbi:hypothetical protein B0H14DRAFT_2640683 [Mycena olivaceomarginata]|nr:hypothetical protein B0H14DRAFT_2640683 [Mycena olivaceomarginata]
MPTNLLRILFASACLSTLLYIIELAVVGINMGRRVHGRCRPITIGAMGNNSRHHLRYIRQRFDRTGRFVSLLAPLTHIYLLIAFFVFLLATHVSPEREIRAKVPPIRSLSLLLHHFWNTARPWVGSVSVGTKIHWLAHVEHSLGTVGAIACAGTDILLRIGLATFRLESASCHAAIRGSSLVQHTSHDNTLLRPQPRLFSIQGEIYTFNLLALFCTAISETNEGAADSESALEFQVASRGGCNTEEEQPRSGPV